MGVPLAQGCLRKLLTLAPEAETQVWFSQGPEGRGGGVEEKKSVLPTVGAAEQVQSRPTSYQDRRGWVPHILEFGSHNQRLPLSPAASLLL